MKTIQLTIILICTSLASFAQVGIGNTDPKASLDITASNVATPSSTDGILIPKIDNFPATNPGADQDGMLVFVTGNGAPTKGFYYWDQDITGWINVTGVKKIDDLIDGKSDSDGTQDGSSIFLGVDAGAADDSSANENIGIGAYSLANNTSGNGNTAVGYGSLYFNTTGSSNISLGSLSLYKNIIGSGNIAIGYSSLFNNYGDQNIALGGFSLENNTSGENNIALGHNSLQYNTLGFSNIALGNNSMRQNISGDNNIAFGSSSLSNNTFGDYNIAFGPASLYTNTAGISNIAFGRSSLTNNTTGSSNIGLGDNALYNNTNGESNVAFGYHSLYDNTTGGNNIALGFLSSSNNTIGSNNISFGNRSLLNKTSGNNNIALGGGSGLNNLSGSDNIFVGNSSGFNETGSDKLYIENSGADGNNALIYGEFDNDILRTNGEFQIGNPSLTGYAFPTTDGTANQVMTTDGAGNITFTTPTTITDTDNQTIDNLTLNGTTLEISLEDDAQPLQTVNLAALQDGIGSDNQNLQTPTLTGTTLNLNIENGTGTSINLAPLQDGIGTDNQTIDNLTLNGTILEISLEDDAQPLQTVNLAALQDGTGSDNQNLQTPTLSGTTLNLNIENGTGTSIDLATLQDGTGNDWSLTGNSGTDSSIEFIGTTDNEALSFRTNNTEKIRLSVKGQIETFNTGNSVFIGESAGELDDLSDNKNIGIGAFSLLNNTAGYNNVSIGVFSLTDNTIGSSNISLGTHSLSNNTSGHANISLGYHSLYHNTTGHYNISLGYLSLNNNTTASNNIAIGDRSLESVTTGSGNVAIGTNAGRNNLIGRNNVLIGNYSGFNETGDNKLYIENSTADSDNALIYGDFDNDILRTNGEFQIGNPTSTGYAFPTIDGTTGQVMTTDGTGNITFVTPAVFTDTDNQTIDNLTLNGTVLELSLEDDAQPLQTLNLAPLQDGNTQNTLDGAYDEGGNGAGKNIDATDGAVRINGSDGFLVTGTFGSGNTIDTEVTGSGTRMFFNPNKAAFRAGVAVHLEWDDANIGEHSVAMGQHVTASGDNTIAFGWQTTASGLNSAVWGRNTVASGSFSTAFGDNTTASTHYATAFGGNTTASGHYSTAYGESTTASGWYATAFGLYTTAPSYAETTIGMYNSNYAHSSDLLSISSDRLFTIGNGTSANRKNALTIYKSGLMNINDAYNMPTTDGIADQIMTTDGAGNVTFETPLASFAATKVLLNADQNLTATGWDKLNFDTANFDLNGNFNTTTDRFVAVNAGVYQVTASYHSEASSTSTNSFGIGVYVDGTLNKRTQVSHYGAGLIHREVTTLVQLTAGQYIEIFAYHSGAITIESNSGRTAFEIIRMR